MSIHAIDADRHRGVRVGRDLASARGVVAVAMAEFAQCAADYPLALAKDPASGRFRAVALLAFEPDANYFLGRAGWNATGLPRDILRRPFVLGVEPADSAGDDGLPTLCIDETSAAFGAADGERLFDDSGQETPFAARMRALLLGMRQDIEATEAFVAAMTRHRLVSPLVLTLHDAAGSSHRIDGLYSISNAALRGLDDAAIAELNRNDYLAPAYCLMLSLGQINRLRQLRNQTGASAIGRVDVTLTA